MVKGVADPLHNRHLDYGFAFHILDLDAKYIALNAKYLFPRHTLEWQHTRCDATLREIRRIQLGLLRTPRFNCVAVPARTLSGLDTCYPRSIRIWWQGSTDIYARPRVSLKLRQSGNGG